MRIALFIIFEWHYLTIIQQIRNLFNVNLPRAVFHKFLANMVTVKFLLLWQCKTAFCSYGFFLGFWCFQLVLKIKDIFCCSENIANDQWHGYRKHDTDQHLEYRQLLLAFFVPVDCGPFFLFSLFFFKEFFFLIF